MINYKSYINKTLIIIFDSCTLSVSLPNLISLPVHKSLSHFLTTSRTLQNTMKKDFNKYFKNNCVILW